MFGVTDFNQLDLGFTATGLALPGAIETAPNLIFENKMSLNTQTKLNEEDRMQWDKQVKKDNTLLQS